METTGDAVLLRFYLGNTDKLRHNLLSEVIVFAAKRYGLSGATVLKGIMGFGSSSIVHSVKFWEITEKLPVVVEIIDEEEKINGFIESVKPWFDKITNGFLITTEKVNIVAHKRGKRKSRFA